MPTTKKRINISLSENMELAISKLAWRDQVPEATKAAELIRLALEVEEDGVWDKLATKRDTKNAKFLSRARAWK